MSSNQDWWSSIHKSQTTWLRPEIYHLTVWFSKGPSLRWISLYEPFLSRCSMMPLWNFVHLFIMRCFGAKLWMTLRSSRLQKLLSEKLFLNSSNMVILTNSSVIQKSLVDPQSSPWKSKLETKILHNATLSGNIHFSSLFDEVAPDRIKRISCGGVIC